MIDSVRSELEDGLVPRRFLTADEVEQLPKPEYLIDGTIVAGSLAVLYGAPGSYKSFLALDLAMSVATGVRWLGRSVLPGPFLYVAGEGNSGMGTRVRAWRENRNWRSRVNGFFLTTPAGLSDGEAMRNLINDMMREINAELNEWPRLIVIDTLSRDLAGADENSQAEMSKYISNIDTIRKTTQAAVLLIHHTNASAERERGSTVLRGAADTMLQTKIEDDVVVLSCEKQKDDRPFEKMLLCPIPVGESVVLGRSEVVRPGGQGLTATATEILAALHEGHTEAGATSSDWLAMFPKMHKATFFRGKKYLLENDYVEGDAGKRGARFKVTDKGKRTLVAFGRIKVAATESVKVAALPARLESAGTATNAADEDFDLWKAEREVA